MIYVGIYVAKKNHFASALPSDGEVLIEPFEFSNDYDGFSEFLSALSSFEQDDLFISLSRHLHHLLN